MATPGSATLKRPVGRPRKIPRTKEEEEEFKKRQMKAMAQRAAQAQMMRDVSLDEDYMDDDDDDDFDEDDLDDEEYDSEDAAYFDMIRHSKNRPGRPRAPKARQMEPARQNKSLMCKPIMMTKATSCNPIRVGKVTQTEFGDPDEKEVFIPMPFPLVVPSPMVFNVTPVPNIIPIPVALALPSVTPMHNEAIDRALKELQVLYDNLPPDEEGKEPAEKDNVKLADILKRLKLDVMEINSKKLISGEQKEDHVKLGDFLDDSEKKIENELKGEKMNDAESEMVEGDYNQDVGQVDSAEHDKMEQHPDLDADERPEDDETPGDADIPEERLDFMQKVHKQSSVITQKQLILKSIPLRHVTVDDADMRLKYSYGVKAYKLWALKKNAELQAAWKELCQKDSDCIPPFKPVKSELLACSTSELSFYIASFVNESTKQNGEQYCSDSIYYFCLGIQHYLYENGRSDDIFHDDAYVEFIEAMHAKLVDYQLRLNNQGLLVCHVTEEHLWESKCLGVQSPHVLLETLVYLNTKNFLLTSTDAHMGLSFSNVMKQWKKNVISSDGKPARTVYLKYNPLNPMQAALEKKQRGDLMSYEQLENVENPYRCPVKLYEFYLSKCPDSTKHRSDLFYLQPEPCCIPLSPVWFSSNQLDQDMLTMMVTRSKVVREVQESLMSQKTTFITTSGSTSTPIEHSLANGQTYFV